MLVTLPLGRRTKRKDNTEALKDADEQAGREITAVNFDVSLSSPDFDLDECLKLHKLAFRVGRYCSYTFLLYH